MTGLFGDREQKRLELLQKHLQERISRIGLQVRLRLQELCSEKNQNTQEANVSKGSQEIRDSIVILLDKIMALQSRILAGEQKLRNSEKESVAATAAAVPAAGNCSRKAISRRDTCRRGGERPRKDREFKPPPLKRSNRSRRKESTGAILPVPERASPSSTFFACRNAPVLKEDK